VSSKALGDYSWIVIDTVDDFDRDSGNALWIDVIRK